MLYSPLCHGSAFAEPAVGENAEEDDELDLSAIARPRSHTPLDTSQTPDDEVDANVSARFTRDTRAAANSRKGKVLSMEWDAELEDIARAKAAAESLAGV